MAKRLADIDKNRCVACGECAYTCKREAVSIFYGCYAVVDTDKCVGCGICEKNCPANCISIVDRK